MSEKNVLWICLTAKYEPDAVSFVTSSVTELVILSPIRRLETVAMVTVVAVAKPVTSVAELRFQSRPQTSLRVQFAKYSRVETRGGKCCQILPKNFGSEAHNSWPKRKVRDKDVFSLSKQDLGRTNLTKHHIYTRNPRTMKPHLCHTSLAECVKIKRLVAARHC